MSAVAFCLQVVRKASGDVNDEDEGQATVAEQLEKANNNLSKRQWTHHQTTQSLKDSKNTFYLNFLWLMWSSGFSK